MGHVGSLFLFYFTFIHPAGCIGLLEHLLMYIVLCSQFGNSLAYLNANGNGGSASPQILRDMLIPSNNEFSIFSAEKCGPECGFSRAQDVAYSKLHA